MICWCVAPSFMVFPLGSKSFEKALESHSAKGHPSLHVSSEFLPVRFQAYQERRSTGTGHVEGNLGNSTCPGFLGAENNLEGFGG